MFLTRSKVFVETVETTFIVKFLHFRPASPKLKRLFDLKGCDWSQLCDQANNEQSNIVFKNVFEQCKDLRIVLTNDVSVASASSSSSTINQNVVSVAPVRQSARSRTKVETTEWTDDAETNAKVTLITDTSPRWWYHI